MNESSIISPDLDSLIAKLLAIREQVGGSAVVAVAGFETMASNWIAEADMVVLCETESSRTDNMSGNLNLKKSGAATVWLGWSQDYRTNCFLRAVADPGEFASD